MSVIVNTLVINPPGAPIRTRPVVRTVSVAAPPVLGVMPVGVLVIPARWPRPRGARVITTVPTLIDYASRAATMRGLYRVFNAAAYRFYRSSVAPPAPGDSPFATSATLPSTPASTYADGTWYVSVSYFNGVIDSGFLPVGPHGETFLTLEISGGVALGTRPSPPMGVRLEARAGGVVRVIAFYGSIADGANAADTWSIGYTVDGSTPGSNAPAVAPAMAPGPLCFLVYDLPAQADGTTVKVQLQTRRGLSTYSTAGAVLAAVAEA